MGDELASKKSLLLNGSGIIIPPALRKQFLHDLYEEHACITSCQHMAITLIYWSCIKKDVEDCIMQCPTCIRLSLILPAESLLNHNVPQGPWQKLMLIFLDWDGRKYLLMIHYFSKYPLFFEVSSTIISAFIGCLTELFDLTGSPLEVFSNNGQSLKLMEWYTILINIVLSILLAVHSIPSPEALLNKMSTL